MRQLALRLALPLVETVGRNQTPPPLEGVSEGGCGFGPAAAATDEVVCVRVGGTNVGCYRLEGPGTYDLLPDDQIDGEWPNPADVIGVPLVDVTFDYVATSAGDLPRVVFWNLDSSADMARQMIDNLKLAGYIPN